MEGLRFDEYSKTMATGLSRRGALRHIGAGGLAAGLMAADGLGRGRASAQAEGTPIPGGEQPSAGWTLHIDAKLHFPGDPDRIAHHWCKPVAGGMIECQLYDGNGADASLVGVEVVVPAATWQTFGATEQALWHYHKVEIPLVDATLPDSSPDEAATVVASLQETYGKVYLLWDPSQTDQPTGQPSVYVLPTETATPTS